MSNSKKNYKKTQKRTNLRYLPKRLTYKDKQIQSRSLIKSKKMYKQGKYYLRKSVKSFKSKPSRYVSKAKKLYNVNIIGATNELSKASGCSKEALAEIIRKGEGAYYSSGSRPNQTPQSWGIARLASALTSGKAGAVDNSILMKGCKQGSLGYRMAKQSYKKHKYGHRHIPKVKLIL